MATDFHETITKICITHFNNLPKTGKPTTNQWTVLSCIVKQNNDHLEVVSLGTGSKCIGKSKMSPKGDILNDSHAEIICRRAFLRYIYDQLDHDSEIFNYNQDISKYSLKNSISFHFFTSHMPCGDATIFPKQDSIEFGNLLPSTKLKRSAKCDVDTEAKKRKINSGDVFRTGAKCLPEETRQDLFLSGSEYHTTGAVRTKPGRGDPTLSVSCSDKLAKWGVLGVQGALLSLLIEEPIFLSSFSIAGETPYCEKSLIRSLFGRFNSIEINKVSLGQALTGFDFGKNNSKQPCPSSIIWCKTKSQALEVAVDGKKQGVTKKKQNTKAGRLQITKIELFRIFLNVTKRLKLNIFPNNKLDQIPYHEAKAFAEEYQKKWEFLKCNGFNVWTIKDKTLNNFFID